MGFNGDSMGFNGIGDGMPSGNLLQFAIENGPVEIVELPIIMMMFHSYVNAYTRGYIRKRLLKNLLGA